jgi:hypothetical protein
MAHGGLGSAYPGGVALALFLCGIVQEWGGAALGWAVHSIPAAGASTNEATERERGLIEARERPKTESAVG